MMISPAGILVVMAIFVVLLSRTTIRHKFVTIYGMCMMADFFLNLGYFLLAGDTILKVADFIQAVLFGLSIYIMLTSKNSKSVYRNTVLIVAVLALNLIMLKILPYGGLVRSFDAMDLLMRSDIYIVPSLNFQSYKSAVRILVFIVNCLVFASLITPSAWSRVRQRLIKCGVFIVSFCWIEFFIKNFIGLNTKPIMDIIFGKTIIDDMLLIRNQLITVHGLASEPSQLAMILFYFLVFFVIAETNCKISVRDKKIIWSGVLILLLSGSFRAIGLIPWIVAIYVVRKGKVPVFVPASVIVIALILFVNISKLEFYSTRFTDLFLFLANPNTSEYTEVARLVTIVEAFEVFLQKPFIGVGLGTTFAYGFLPSILVTMGLMGAITWYHIIFNQIARVMSSRSNMTITAILSFVWLYTSAIDIAYSSVVLAIAMEMLFSKSNTPAIKEFQPCKVICNTEMTPEGACL